MTDREKTKAAVEAIRWRAEMDRKADAAKAKRPPCYRHVTEATDATMWPMLSCGHRAPSLFQWTCGDGTPKAALPPVGLVFHCAECAKGATP